MSLRSRGASMVTVTFEMLYTQRPAVRHRALVISATLLLVSCALAMQLTLWRSARLLGATIGPQGWGFTFRPPSGFLSGDPIVTALGQAIPFHGSPNGEPVAELIVWRMESPTRESPAKQCGRVLAVLRTQSSWPTTQRLQRPAEKVTRRSIGSRAAHEVHDMRSGIVVRAAAVGPMVAVCVSLRVAQPPISPEFLAVLDRVSASFVFDGE